MNECYKKIISINASIEDAKLRYRQRQLIDEDMLEFLSEDDLKRYIAACNYEKTEYIKDNIGRFKDELSFEVSTEDKKLIRKIITLKECIPGELHKCIGCPCLENDYPNCHKCIFYESCTFGSSPYPSECDETDCYRTFSWMKEHEEIVKEALQKILG